MGNRRMFSLAVVDTDKFIDMPISARLLYYELGMRADDDGFVSSAKKIVRMVGCSEDDLKLLISKNFAICFENGIIVITHWKMHNYIPKDRYHKTIFQEEYSKLEQKNDVYMFSDTTCIQPVYKTDTTCIQDGNKPYTEVKLSKDNINNIVEQDSTSYISQIKEIIDYLNLKIGTSYKASTKSTQKHINARLKEGYTVDDFKQVIDRKAEEWQNTDMSKYLRPDTLFGAKFESYLNVPAQQNSEKADPFRGYDILN